MHLSIFGLKYYMETGIKRQWNADKDAEWSQLMEKHHSVILRVCELFYPKDSYGEEELRQEILCQLWRGFRQRRKDVPEGVWVYRVAVNTAISSNRADERRPENVPITRTLAENLADKADMGRERMLDDLHELVMLLEPLDKAMMDLYIEGYPQAEIARIFSMTETNVSTRVGRIKKKLINIWEKQ